MLKSLLQIPFFNQSFQVDLIKIVWHLYSAFTQREEILIPFVLQIRILRLEEIKIFSNFIHFQEQNRHEQKEVIINQKKIYSQPDLGKKRPRCYFSFHS